MEEKKPAVWRCYIHFEHEPTPQELDDFFRHCRQYKQVFPNSYYFVIGKDVVPFLIADYVMSFFRKYNYALCNVRASFTVHRGNP